MVYVVGFFVIALAALTLWNVRMRRGYTGEEHVARNVDPRNDPEIRRYGSTWY